MNADLAAPLYLVSGCSSSLALHAAFEPGDRPSRQRSACLAWASLLSRRFLLIGPDTTTWTIIIGFIAIGSSINFIVRRSR